MHSLTSSKAGLLTALVFASSLSVEAQALHLASSGSYLQPITVIGEVNKPGTYSVDASQTAGQLLAIVGGVTADAGPTAFLVHFASDAPLTPLSRLTLVQLAFARPTPSNITVTRISLAETRTRNLHLSLDSQDILFVPSASER